MDFKNTIKFIHEYRNMETSPVEVIEKVITRIIKEAWKAEHLIRKWKGYKGSFDYFYLHIDYGIKAEFLRGWNIPIEVNLTERYYNTSGRLVTILVPEFLLWTHLLIMYFSNNYIGQDKEYEFDDLPSSEYCFGDAKNWGIYLLSLPEEERIKLLTYIYKKVMPEDLLQQNLNQA